MIKLCKQAILTLEDLRLLTVQDLRSDFLHPNNIQEPNFECEPILISIRGISSSKWFK